MASRLVLALALCCSGSAAAELTASAADLVVQRIYNQLDCDLDGTVEPDEVDEHFAQVWAPMDRDGSRTLSAMEYGQLVGTGGAPQARERQRQLFRDADADASAAIDPAEMRAHLRRLIVLADRNGDYEVTRTEVGLAARPPARNRRPEPGAPAGTATLAND